MARWGGRLCDARDFRRVQRVGERRASPNFVALLAPVANGVTARQRLGLTVSRRVGGAVVRNRVKRWVRNWFRVYHEELQIEGDLVVIARRGAAGLGYAAVVKELSELMMSRDFKKST